MIDLGGTALESAQSVSRQPIAALVQGPHEAPVQQSRRVPGDVGLSRVALRWALISKASLRGVLLHHAQCRTQRPFTLRIPGDAADTTVIYAGPPRWSLRNAVWGDLSVDLLEVDSAEF